MNKNWIKIASIYIGTVIGAGFASGREIMDFFGLYGSKGIWGIYISGILFSLGGSLLLLKIYNNKIKSFKNLAETIFKGKVLVLVDIIINISLYTGFTIMVAGSGAIFKEQLDLSFNLGMIVMLVASFIVFLFDLKGLSLINTILVPLLIIGILFISIYIGSQGGIKVMDISGENITGKGNFISSAILYFGSNCLIIIIVFSTLLPLIKDRKTAVLAGSLGGGILYILGTAILFAMLMYYEEIINLDIPMLRISNHIGTTYGIIYGIILWISMFTTALANGYGFVSKYSKNKDSILPSTILCLSAVPLAKLGFANLVSVIYPIFGLIGFTMMVLFLIK